MYRRRDPASTLLAMLRFLTHEVGGRDRRAAESAGVRACVCVCVPVIAGPLVRVAGVGMTTTSTRRGVATIDVSASRRGWSVRRNVPNIDRYLARQRRT